MSSSSFARIVNHFNLRVFFVGETRFEVHRSRYSQSARSTNSTAAIRREWLKHSVDKARLKKINEDIREAERKRKELEDKVRGSLYRVVQGMRRGNRLF